MVPKCWYSSCQRSCLREKRKDKRIKSTFDAINTEVESVSGSVLGSEVSHDSDNVSSTVLSECSRNDFHGEGNSLNGELVHAFLSLGIFSQAVSHFHFNSSSSR